MDEVSVQPSRIVVASARVPQESARGAPRPERDNVPVEAAGCSPLAWVTGSAGIPRGRTATGWRRSPGATPARMRWWRRPREEAYDRWRLRRYTWMSLQYLVNRAPSRNTFFPQYVRLRSLMMATPISGLPVRTTAGSTNAGRHLMPSADRPRSPPGRASSDGRGRPLPRRRRPDGGCRGYRRRTAA